MLCDGGHLDYCMTEGCGIFAVALSCEIPGGALHVLSRRNGERWSRSVPEVTHVAYLAPGDSPVDARGFRSFDDMAADFGMNATDPWGARSYCLLGPYEPAEFRRRFMGASDRKPL